MLLIFAANVASYAFSVCNCYYCYPSIADNNNTASVPSTIAINTITDTYLAASFGSAKVCTSPF